MIFINFKTYEQGTGANALRLIRLLDSVSESTGIKIVPVVQVLDLKEASVVSDLPIWSQNIDPADYGAHTGSILPEAVKEDGAQGTFLNHSEHRFKKLKDLEVAHARALEVGLKTLIFAGDTSELSKVAKLKPDFVSFEPPELVGSKTTSVSEAKPEVIGKAVKIADKQGIPLIIGAGIKSAEDVRVGLALGATGFAVASSVVTSNDPKGAVMDLIKGYGQ